MFNQKEIVKKIKILMIENGIRASELRKKLGMGTVKWTNRMYCRTMFSLKELYDIAHIFGIEPTKLL